MASVKCRQGLRICPSACLQAGLLLWVRRRDIYDRLLRGAHQKCGWVVRRGWLGSRVVSVLDSGAEGPGFKSQPRLCRVTVLGKLFTPIMPLFTKQQNW